MIERRSLIEGIKPQSREEAAREKAFVFGESNPVPAVDVQIPVINREDNSKSPISTRIRTDYAVAVKRASLERQLNGIRPSAINEILEEALAPWLKKEGYL